VLYELRPFQIVQTPNQVLILYMFEKRWRVIWTDGRPLPKDPDPRWYGYSVGHWEDDTTFVVNTIGTDERTWLDNAGNPHSAELKVEERYHRINPGSDGAHRSPSTTRRPTRGAGRRATRCR
jgi:hypothetical protein